MEEKVNALEAQSAAVAELAVDNLENSLPLWKQVARTSITS